MSAPPTRRRLARVPLLVWVFLLVPLAAELFWVFWPAANSFSLALTRWDGIGLAEPVGLQNFRDLADDPIFLTALRNNVIWVVGFGGLSVVGGLALAVTLNRPGPFVGLYRSAIYLPMVVSLAVSGLFWRVMYAPEGPVNAALGALGLESLERQWLADPAVALGAVLVAAVWRQVGYIMVLYLAGLKGTDGSLEEAAAVDGANAWQRFWRIVMPQLRGVSTVVFAVTVIDSLRTFDIVWAMTRGGPYNETQLLSTYMFQQAFTTGNLGYASAIAVVIFALAIGFIITYLARQARTED
ncbi:carbohydrate ABC transporter permease [Promicromonospora citrea]|uniref:Lactose ABC transporter permease n=1 Tax=Promicromonospora citrea TaxID=43677 RepID=A0A8H9GFH1_9MICO|nr:sugar ABC transporter permease [Promicromonospora citrea]NNH52111.1 sugar ABC transporter permease [Promicromonospora citrea]GGM17479.1 lactose ABC transporter permease [Promicromonospora citrea]